MTDPIARRVQRSYFFHQKMSESPAESTQHINNDDTPEIQMEIVSEEEMALIDAALATATRCFTSLPSQLFQGNARSIDSITSLAKRRLFSGGREPDIEDLGRFPTQKRNRVAESFLDLFRQKRGLSVRDITGTEWCEKQMEFILLSGERRVSEAMRVGHARHLELEEEIAKKVKVPAQSNGVRVQSDEDRWAFKFVDFIRGAKQLLSQGLTRELPLFGFIEGVWMVGQIDEIQMPVKETNDRNPIILEIKTRVLETLPLESQRRNGRLQLMCYKYMWDTLAAGEFPSSQFFHFFSLNPYYVLSNEVTENLDEAGCPAMTLDDIVRLYINTWSTLPPAHDQMLLRYEFQKDHSLLGEVEFTYDHDWLKGQIQGCIGFWKGEREASYIPDEERWKCRYCQFACVCPANVKPASSQSPSKTSFDSTPSQTKHGLYFSNCF